MSILFGVFDRFHEGHAFLLTTVRARGAEPIVCIVARDSVVQQAKGGNPERQSEDVRCAVLRQHGVEARLGDEEQGTYAFLRQAPAHWDVCLGYDQQSLGRDLERRMASGELPRRNLWTMPAHRPDELHTSLLYPARV